MKKLWFKRKTYGWGWTFGTWESFAVMALYIVANVFVFRAVDLRSHSESDTLINFAPRFLLLTAVLYLVCWWKGEKPRTWRPCLQVQVSDILVRGGVVVMPTDTTYGIVGSAMNERSVHEIYRLRKRDLDKPLIILIADKKDLKKFGVVPTEAEEKILDRVWPARQSPDGSSRMAGGPGAVSVILSCKSEKFAYLHRGKNTLAFRVPPKESLRKLLRGVGPLIAPSANPQGHPVARTISEARAYFGHPVRASGFYGNPASNGVNHYEDGGTIAASPSRLIDITDGTEKVLRS